MQELKDEFDGCEFGDRRLHKRVISLANKLSENPETSIYAACGSSSESKALPMHLKFSKSNGI